MRRANLVLLASMFMTAGATLAACGGGDSNNHPTSGSGGGGGAGGATSSSTTSTGGMDAGPDVDHGKPSNHYPAPHPNPPYVQDLGGPVLATPNVYPIVFSNDDGAMTTQIGDFVANVGATPYWAATTAEYCSHNVCVGALNGNPLIQQADAAPTSTTDDEIQQYIAAQIDAEAWPAPDDNTLYALFYPSGTTITQSSGGQSSASCVDFGGYHNGFSHNGQNVAYAVIPRCLDFDGFSGIDAVTAAASHEFIEAATDPYPMNEPAYGQPDNDHIYWLFALGGGETGDMCAQELSSFTKFPPFSYMVQRSWSNHSAALGHDPCVPIPTTDGPYFNAAPVLPDLLNIAGAQVHGVKIPVGQTRDVELDLFSDGDTGGPFQVEAHDLSAFMGGQPELSFTIDRDSGVNGEKLYLSVTVEQASPYNAEIFIVSSRLNGVHHSWVGLVGN